VQPLRTIVIRQPFHWGLVFIQADGAVADMPDVDPDHLISANATGIMVRVRHAQDTDSTADPIEFAEVEVTVRVLTEPEDVSASRRVAFQGALAASTGRITFGDADRWIVVPAHVGANELVISVDVSAAIDELFVDAFRVDVLPGSATG
jgi:hypothetical protein